LWRAASSVVSVMRPRYQARDGKGTRCKPRLPPQL
jgi:hypothetical protein